LLVVRTLPEEEHALVAGTDHAMLVDDLEFVPPDRPDPESVSVPRPIAGLAVRPSYFPRK
jgi:hypothetical protein